MSPYTFGYSSSFVFPYEILDVSCRLLPKHHAEISRGTSLNGGSAGGQPPCHITGVHVTNRARRPISSPLWSPSYAGHRSQRTPPTCAASVPCPSLQHEYRVTSDVSGVTADRKKTCLHSPVRCQLNTCAHVRSLCGCFTTPQRRRIFTHTGSFIPSFQILWFSFPFLTLLHLPGPSAPR